MAAPQMQIRKQQSHGKIGEAAVAAKCWMHGIPAYNTAGLRANFAGSDLLVDTPDPTRKLLIQVKTGYNPSPDWVYMTQCAGEHELEKSKFVSDFVVFVGIRIKRWTIASCDFPQTTLDSGLSGGRHVAWVAFSCCLRGYRRSEFGHNRTVADS